MPLSLQNADSKGRDGAHAKPGTVLSTSHQLTIFALTTALGIGTLTTPTLQLGGSMESQSVPGRAGMEPQQAVSGAQMLNLWA